MDASPQADVPGADVPGADVPGIDVDRLRSWMVGATDQVVTGHLMATLLAGGRSNISALLQDEAGSQWVVRRPPLGHVMPSAHDMGREFRVMSGLGSVGQPVPRALALCTDPEVTGATFMLMSYVPGLVIDSADKALELGALKAGRVSEALVNALAGVHQVDASRAGLEQLGRPEGYLSRQLGRWSQQWELTRTRELSDVGDLATRLATPIATVPAGLPWSIVHGDFRLDNTILDPSHDRVAAIVDWEMATLGDPISDLAIALVYWTQADDGLRSQVPVAQAVTSQPGFWTREQIIGHYSASSGLELEHLDACTALACFKLAVIMESIRFRALEGMQLGAGADEADSMARATEALAQLGHAVLDVGTVIGLAS